MRVYSIVYWSVLKLEKFPGTGCLCISLVRSVKSRPYLLLSLPRFYSLFSPLHLFTACGCPPEGVGMGLKYSLSPIYWSVCPPEEGALGVPRWPSRVKIWCCPCCGSGLIPGCRISTCCGYGQKKKGPFFFWLPYGIRSSLVQDQIWAAVATYVASMAVPDPLIPCAMLGIEPVS